MLVTLKETSWRAVPEYQGGFLLDGGVHLIAALRMILGPRDQIATISALTSLQQQYLPPKDTVEATIKTKGGATGMFSVSYGSHFKDLAFAFDCERGVVELAGDGVLVDGKFHEVPFDGKGVVQEVAGFAASIAKGGPSVDKRQSPEEALADLEVLETMLTSGEKDGEKKDLSLQV